MQDFIYHVYYDTQDKEHVFEGYQKWLPLPQDIVVLPTGFYVVTARAFDLSESVSAKYYAPTTPLGNSINVYIEVSELSK